MRTIDVDVGFPLNPKMKQVHLKLLLCLLLATGATGQATAAGAVGQNFGAQPLGVGQSSMSAWGGFSSPGAFQQQPTAAQLGSGFGQAGAGSAFGGGFGQGGFGQAGLGQSGFGQGGFGQAGLAQGGLGQGGIGQAGLGQSGFGQGGFGQAGFGQGGLGQGGFGQAGLGQSGFGQGGFGQGGSGQGGFGQGGFGQGGLGQGGFGQAGLGQGGFGQGGFGQAGVEQGGAPQQATADTRVTGSDVTSGTMQQQSSSVAVPASSRSVSTNVCYNIIDSAFPSFSHYCSVLPQTTFSLPNFFGHNSKQDASNLMNDLRPALDSECFQHIRMFTCPLFFPPCDSDAILPCASFCRAVKNRCNAFDLSAISCNQLPEKSEFCPSIVESTRAMGSMSVQDRSSSYNDYGSQTRFANDYPSTSVLTRSSPSYGGANNDLLRPRNNNDGYYGGNNVDTSSDRVNTIITVKQVPKAASDSYGYSSGNDGGARGLDWTVDESSSSSYSNGGATRSVPVVVKSRGSGYGPNTVTRQQDSVSGGGYGGSSYGNDANVRAPILVKSNNYGGESAYGNNIRVNPSTSYDNTDSYGSNVRSGGSAFGTAIKSVAPADYDSTVRSNVPTSFVTIVKNVAPSSYGNGGSYGGSSYGNSAKSFGSGYGNTVKSTGSGSYGNRDNYDSGSSYGNTVKSVEPTAYGNSNNYGSRSSYGNTVKFVEPTPYGGGSSYGNTVKSVEPTTYGNSNNYGGGSSSYGTTVKSSGSGSYGNGNNYGSGSSSYGNTVKSTGSGSYGNGNNYGSGSSSYGNTVKSTGSGSYGNGNSYGSGSSSSYGNTAKSTGSGSYGNGNSYGSGSSYGNTVKSTGSGSYGNGNGYGSGSYGNSGSYGSSYATQPTGPPYGIQSTGEYTTYYPEKLDLSRCGPTPTENPCTLDGPQYYPIPGYPSCYIQCSLERMFVKPCPNYLVWNARINVCDWPTVAEYPSGNNNYGASSYGGNNNNNYGSSSYSTANRNTDSGSSYSYGRKKRSTTERKKRFFPGLFSDPINFEVPLGPPVPGLLPLPGFPGPIGIPGPLIPPFFGPGFPPIPPPFIPPIGPIPPPIIPPVIPPIAPIPPPILPPPLPPFLPPIVPPLPIPLGGPLLPPLPMSIPATFIPGPPPIFGSPFFGGGFGGGFGGPLGGGFGGGFGGPLGGGFGGGFGGPLGGPLGGPFGGPFGPFGGPFGPIGAPFGGPLEPFGGPFGPFAGPFGFEPFFDNPFDSDFGFGGGFPFGDEFYGGHPGPFFEPFPFPAGFDIYGDSDHKRGSKKGNDYGYDNDYGKSYGKSYKKKGDYDNSYSSYGDRGYGKSSDYKKSGNFQPGKYKKSNGYSSNKDYDDYSSYKKGYNGYSSNRDYDDYSSSKKGYNGYSSKNDYDDYSPYKKDYNSYSSYKNDDSYGGNYYRKRRNYGLNVDQDTSIPMQKQERLLSQQLKVETKPNQWSSYGSSNQQQQQQQPRLLTATTFQQQNRLPIESINQLSLCSGKSSKTNVAHPTDATKYISCLNDDKYEIMDCPSSLIYNAAADQCEKVKNTESVCEREQPCMNGGQCYQTSPSSYKCTCRGSWTGEHCETPVSSCASNPCGENNECHTLVASDYKQDYVCVCNGRQSYGLSCERNTVPNPCMTESKDREQYYPFAYSARAYVQCNGDIFYARPCSDGLFWNQEAKICDREETSPARPAEDQPRSFQINYNTQEPKLAFTRPVVSALDQNVDKQQGYRYRNYNPNVGSNDQSRTFNQINSRIAPSNKNVFYSLPTVREQQRRLQSPQSVVADQQYGEQTATFAQPTPQRSMFRFFQSPSLRTVNTAKTQSSSYRR